jgi:hypothetical protein
MQHRQDWIGRALEIYGFINREHLERKFGVSNDQAKQDLQLFVRTHPDDVRYNEARRRWESTRYPPVGG